MNSSSTDENNLPLQHPKTTVLTTLTVFLEAIADRITNPDWRQILIPVAPLVALGITYLLKSGYKRHKCNQMIKLIKSWITELKEEITNPNTTFQRKKDAQKEIAKHQEDLKKIEKDAIGGIDFSD